jgi:ADP-dependent phosphofructokinase/glucokinase
LKRTHAVKRRQGCFMEDSTWHDLYRNLEPPPLGRTIVGFNVNIDRIIPVTERLLNSLPSFQGEMAVFPSRLYRSMQTCTADELFVRDTRQYRQFIHHFSGSSAIGGQAGIAAVQLASAGVPEVICIAPSMGVTTQAMLREAGVTIPNTTLVPAKLPDIVHLVFEYSPGLVPLAEGAVPRNNRFIVSPHHDPSTVILNKEILREFRNAASTCDRAFLSGYQYLTSDKEFRNAADQLVLAKKENPSLRIHVEWVTVADTEITGYFLRYILPHADSLGLNERELGFVHRSQNPAVPRNHGHTPLSASELAQQAIDICRSTGLVRLHLHTFGYYIVICKDPLHPEKTRDALLFASRSAAQAAGGTGPGIVSEGHRALEDTAGAFGRELSPGIFRAGEYHIIVIPSLITRGIAKTAGMGDRISSLAFAADPF